MTAPVADKDQPISDAEYARIADLGLSRRSDFKLARRAVDQPITEDQYARIADLGLSKRSSSEVAVEARDSRSNCAKTVTGDKAGGSGIWCPLDQYFAIVERFCQDYSGTDVHIGHETSDTYGITLTNQDDDTKPGAAGNVVCKSPLSCLAL